LGSIIRGCYISSKRLEFWLRSWIL